MGKKVVLGWIGALSLFVILVLLGAGYLVQNNPAYLLDKAAQSLGRKVSARHVDVTFWPIGARLTGVVIAADLSPAAPEFLSAQTLRVDLYFWPLLLGRFEPRHIALESPVLTIARDDGKSRADARARRAKKKRQRHEVIGDDDSPSTTAPQSPPIFLPFPLQIANGTVRFQNGSSENEVLASQIQLRMTEVNSNSPVDFELDAAVTAATPNLKFKGRIGPIGPVDDYRDIALDVALQVDALDMGKINRALPALKTSLPRVLRFDGVYSTQDLTIKGSLHKPSIKGTIKGSDASVRFE